MSTLEKSLGGVVAVVGNLILLPFVLIILTATILCIPSGCGSSSPEKVGVGQRLDDGNVAFTVNSVESSSDGAAWVILSQKGNHSMTVRYGSTPSMYLDGEKPIYEFSLEYSVTNLKGQRETFSGALIKGVMGDVVTCEVPSNGQQIELGPNESRVLSAKVQSLQKTVVTFVAVIKSGTGKEHLFGPVAVHISK